MKTVEFIRNFEYENSDYSRKIRLILAHDPNQLVLHVAGFGDLNIANNHFGQSSSGLLQPPGGPGLLRSKSDHRLAAQFRQDEGRYDRGYGQDQDEQPLSGRKFGERPKNATTTDRYTDRYGRGGGNNDYGDDYDTETPRTRRYSRFRRHAAPENDSDNEQSSRGVRFTEQHKPERERVLDTEDVARGPLSGITRLADSPRVMKKLQENESGKKKEKEASLPQPVQQPKVVPKRPPPPASRQMSEEDEIARIKKQNKGATTSTEAVETRTVDRSTTDDRHTPQQRKTPAPEVSLDEP